ncbi:ribosome biogenesis GTPase A [Vulcanimicrobium alpinum]|uniref:Ribosome biogenesis GTPase A n=1 Tax=Vulcanimicrobium alpinum TaxID=3016050 RepID=A0AAN1XUM8_UNVUL|nr:ribosome biogenesis GTPase YlqF [Vulcanimicrobium alpinum]BDE05320.1 ribosome biogenesis GTPase A [Vulcanimicrobium alpinum]
MAKGGGPSLQRPEIQWYPGHMAQAMRKLGERLAVVDVVIEVVDARLPRASSNPGLDRLAAAKKRIVVLTCDDLADPHATREWLAWYARNGRTAVAVNGKDQTSVKRVAAALDEIAPGGGTTRAMVVGIPNTGKSSIINGLLRRTAAKAEDKAGVTRSLQWFRIRPTLEVMDSPGILVPKIATPDAQWQLALTGALPRERFDAEDVIAHFVAWSHAHGAAHVPDLETFARARGFARRGGDVDLHNAAGAYLKDVGEGKFGRITFERPEAAA